MRIRSFMLVILAAIAMPLAAEPPEVVLQQILGLDSSQVTAIQELVKAHQTDTQPLFRDAEKLEQSLSSALSATTPNPLEVGKLDLAVRDIQKQIGQKQEAFQQSIVALLTEAQQAQLEQIRGVEAAMRAAQALHQLGF